MEAVYYDRLQSMLWYSSAVRPITKTK